MTQSGRCYRLGIARGVQKENTVQDKGKEKKSVQEKQKASVQETEKAPQAEDDQPVDKSKSNFDKKRLKPITKDNAKEFLKCLQHSEYKIVDQLNRLPASISILQLLLSFEPPKKALDKMMRYRQIGEAR
ncbi:hypothetical protein PTKIN_Ptkin03bG0156500 [Pterospermum kingtungense]